MFDLWYDKLSFKKQHGVDFLWEKQNFKNSQEKMGNLFPARMREFTKLSDGRSEGYIPFDNSKLRVKNAVWS